jgi:hypothetical protein
MNDSSNLGNGRVVRDKSSVTEYTYFLDWSVCNEGIEVHGVKALHVQYLGYTGQLQITALEV